MSDYEKYQLQWMIDHDKSIADLVCGLQSVISDSLSMHIDLRSVFDIWEFDAGFGGEIWACECEWEDYGG